MKNKSLVLLVLIISLALVGCSKEEVSEVSEVSKNNFIIGINQFAEHPALDQVLAGFESELSDIKSIELDIINAQADMANTISISEKFIKDEVDLIFSIGTPSAQSSKQVAKDIPIIFSAVTDPIAAGLVKNISSPEANITGTTDESPILDQLSLFKQLDPSVKTIGVIYNTAEANSQSQIERLELVTKDLGLKLETIGVSNLNEIPQATDALVKKVDGIYTITDNMIASAINIIAKKSIENNIITVAAEEAHVEAGILITEGLSYFELGRQSGKMAKKILVENEPISNIAIEKASKINKLYNLNSLNKLNLDINNPAFHGGKAVK